jgi:hypothetical protein
MSGRKHQNKGNVISDTGLIFYFVGMSGRKHQNKK